MFTTGNNIAIEPFEVPPQLTGEVKGGIGRLTNRFNLLAATVAMEYKLSNGTVIKPGDKVYLRSDVAISRPWGKVVYNIGDFSFVLCPESDVLAAEAKKS